MNEKNFEYLDKQIKFTGFGEGHSAELKEMLQQQKPDFTIQHQQDFGTDKTTSTLQFKKSEESDMYFFNRYNMQLDSGREDDPARQTFFINKDDNITLKEAYNLMSGRAVNKDLTTKEGEKYNAWLQLDFKAIDKNGNYETKKYHQNYGFDLKAALEKLAIAELKDPENEKVLLKSLQKGNLQSVTIEKEGNTQKMFIAANPQFKTVNLYDFQVKMVPRDSIEQYQSTGQREAQSVKEEKGTDKKKDLHPVNKPERAVSEKKKENSLLPKKRESAGKGLGM